MKIRISIVIILVLISCKKVVKEESEKVQNRGHNTIVKRVPEVNNIDTIETSKKHKRTKFCVI
ncbi:hypothetical protein [Flavobacterium limi]|uniref:Lipoprotein n=1 Tax=Flavobacterium limi TaxID=2045105 RepID=A0ABQ1UPE5_9FLAO|nr:hypothetical protein [Flavobacterium limi]GGF23295.1 hypothetical protein GCM10011518_35740 [Flavobacterium limi]